MSESNTGKLLHHRGRLHQVPIYLGKLFRSFLYVNDWKMLPMAGVIAALVAMVVRKYFCVSMEGTLIGSFALTCVAIWNGCFNSIQVICRERSIVKREHRSGMHITSYVFSHMVYQALLCAAQTIITLYICKLSGVRFPEKGLFTSWMIVDIGISMFLITYASDMLSLLVSSVVHSTTAAMTVMPFILIFQLIFSGSVIPLPAWARNFSSLTISHYGLTAITAQGDYNNLPMNTGWDTLQKLSDSVVEGDLDMGQLIDFASGNEGLMKKIREKDFVVFSPEIMEYIAANLMENELPSDDSAVAKETAAAEETAPITGSGDGPTALPAAAEPAADEATAAPAENSLTAAEKPVSAETAETPAATAAETVPAAGEVPSGVPAGSETENATIVVNGGKAIDTLLNMKLVQNLRGRKIHYSLRVGDIIDTIGRDKLETYIKTTTAKAMFNAEYALTAKNVLYNWIILIGFILLYAMISTIALEFIDKDKR